MICLDSFHSYSSGIPLLLLNWTRQFLLANWVDSSRVPELCDRLAASPTTTVYVVLVSNDVIKWSKVQGQALSLALCLDLFWQRCLDIFTWSGNKTLLEPRGFVSSNLPPSSLSNSPLLTAFLQPLCRWPWEPPIVTLSWCDFRFDLIFSLSIFLVYLELWNSILMLMLCSSRRAVCKS